LIVLVTYLALTPEPPAASFDFSDKLGHVAAYAGLMGWWLQIDRRPDRLALLFTLMGLALEILQSLGGHRDGDIFDMAANTLGVGLGWLTALLLPDWLARLDRRLARSPDQ
jgi:VanZ family protein